MKKIEQRMQAVLGRGETVLLSGVPVGYPDLAATRQVTATYIKSGIDVVEFSMPSLNPHIDTKRIADSNVAALTREPDLERYFDYMADVRQEFPDEPFYLMAYADILQQYGVEAFVRRLAELEVDGIELPDKDEVVPEVAGALDRALEAAGMYRIYILHHPFDWAYFSRIKAKARGFVLLQSVADAAGRRDAVAPENRDLIARMREAGLAVPIILGYGISSPARVAEAGALGADGVIVGTAMLSWIATHDLAGLGSFIAGLKAATRPRA